MEIVLLYRVIRAKPIRWKSNKGAGGGVLRKEDVWAVRLSLLKP